MERAGLGNIYKPRNTKPEKGKIGDGRVSGTLTKEQRQKNLIRGWEGFRDLCWIRNLLMVADVPSRMEQATSPCSEAISEDLEDRATAAAARESFA